MIKGVCTSELATFPHLKSKASDYRFPTFAGLGLHGNFENNMNLLNYIIIPWSSVILTILFLVSKQIHHVIYFLLICILIQ